MGGVCVTIMEVRYDNMEYLLECCEKLKQKAGHLESILTPHLTFQSSEVASTGHGLCSDQL